MNEQKTEQDRKHAGWHKTNSRGWVSHRPPLTPAECAGRNRAYDAAYLYEITKGSSAAYAHERAQAAAAAYDPPHPERTPDDLQRIIKLWHLHWLPCTDGFAKWWVLDSVTGKTILLGKGGRFTDSARAAVDSLGPPSTSIDVRYEWEVRNPRAATPGPWAQKFQQDAVAAWDELCADPPPGTWFYSSNGHWWSADTVPDGSVAAEYNDAAIIPEHANDGREFVAVRFGVTLPEGLAHPMTEKPVRGGGDD